LGHAQQAARQTVSVRTDKLDYRPGESAQIIGSGFLPREYVRLQVLHTDGTSNAAPQHQPWTVRADSAGGFRSTYLVGTDDLNTTMELSARGLTSNRVARETFTDATNIVRPDHIVVVIEEDR